AVPKSVPRLCPCCPRCLHSLASGASWPAGSSMPTLLPDAALLAGVPEDILCFSRSFEDLTCFWDEEKEEAASGMLSTWHHGAGGMRHVCVFPSQDVRLFTQLHLRVLNATTNQTKYWRNLSVDAVGESLPPGHTPVTPGQKSPELDPLPFCLLWGLAAPCALHTKYGASPEGTASCPPAGPGGAQMGAVTGGQTPWHIPCRSHCPASEYHSPLGWGCGAALCVMAATARRLPELLPLRGTVVPCQVPRDALQHCVGPRQAAPWRSLHPPSGQQPRTHGQGSHSLPGSGAGTQRSQGQAGGFVGHSRSPAWPLSCRGWSRQTPG
uniref:Growth hormone/erythropoietin receptor ligand binding domain-containing protein n=1 Tax=Athene cunicularia TaxID=194338 RepID=A0A663MDV0_ATHCN